MWARSDHVFFVCRLYWHYSNLPIKKGYSHYSLRMCKNLPVFCPCAWLSPVVLVKSQCTDRNCLSSTGLLAFPVWQPWPTRCPEGKRNTVGSLHKTSLKPWSNGRDSARNINFKLRAQCLACWTYNPWAGLRAVTPVLQAHPATQVPGILRAVNPLNSSVGFSVQYCTRAPLLCSLFWFVWRDNWQRQYP